MLLQKKKTSVFSSDDVSRANSWEKRNSDSKLREGTEEVFVGQNAKTIQRF